MQHEEEAQSEILGTITVSAKGQIAIPTKVRRQLEIHKGDKLVIALKDNRMLLIPARGIRRTMENEFKGLLGLAEGSAKELWDNEIDELWNSV